MSMSLSDILKVDVSTYENLSMDVVYEQMEQDLDECKNEDGKIMVQWLWMVDIKKIDCDDWLDWDNFKIDTWKMFQQDLETVDLKGIFAKYGLEYTGITFYTPSSYNTQVDSVDIHLKTMRNSYDLEKMGLVPLIEEYIKNVRQESYDGYMSFEPTTIDDVDITDYCTLWAILKKENIFDELKDTMQNSADEWYSDLVWMNSKIKYMVRTPIGWKPPYKLNYFRLDFDAKSLLPIEEKCENI